MTEAEWLACAVPADYFAYLKRSKRFGGLATERKIYLLRVACCRRIWGLLDEPSRNAVEVAEQFVEGLLDDERRGREYATVKRAAQNVENVSSPWTARARSCAIWSVAHCLEKQKWKWDLSSAANAIGWNAQTDGREWSLSVVAAEKLAQASLLRDVFGNPFRPVVFSSTWRTGTAVSLAAQMYESRDFSAMPILADALQDAGCDDSDILAHCRDANTTHVRGCWVVDGVLGLS